MTVGPTDADPLLSAVVHVRAGPEATGGPAVENPAGVVSEASSMLAGYDLGSPLDPGSPEAAPAGTDVAGQGSAVAAVKAFFTRAGFEVHAPVGTTFSIAATLSHFEDFFGQHLVVDEDELGAPVSVADGARQLSLEALPDDVRALVEEISFLPPPELPGA